ncbi:Pullulanase precursor [Poriferisphaera corsica]|uniref:pullulanase n=1 Tax=Poriferisphaera corsica TaxID=2528020 RepID=A0A517YSN6_9BACT|nr:type I pullulanase [Poriferisphaera corsica]QDU33228.1 Pullulanase precursor [Poriferisphaera corsica]
MTQPNKLTSVLLLLLTTLLLPATTSAAPKLNASAPDMNKVRSLALKPTNGTTFVLHYYRPDGKYDGWNIWTWADGQEGRSVKFTGRDAFGAYATVKYPVRLNKANFIIRYKEWERKDVDRDRSTTVNADGIAEAWAVSEDPNVYQNPADIDFSLRVNAAFLDKADNVLVTLSQPVDKRALKASDVNLSVNGTRLPIRAIQAPNAQGNSHKTFTLVTARKISADELATPISLTLPGQNPVTVYVRDALDSKDLFPADAKLGSYVTESKTTFRTWSPVASSVDLLLFDSEDAATPNKSISMTKADSGLWETTLPSDLHGLFYQYSFTSYGKTRTVADINCFAAAHDSSKSMVVNLSNTNPEGFAEHTPPASKSQTDEIVYEVHVRDFSIQDQNVPAENRGKYSGLAIVNPSTGEEVSTSISHLKELGVTAVHLLPIQDYSASLTEYNWGYWTALFNVPEAQYSSTPHQPAETIKELKKTIQTLHENGIRVILDVVYNHTSTSYEYSPFDQAVPYYYFRTGADGTLANESGCGNAFADERLMARKYMIDSLKYWVTEYKVDGFRFDLLGMHYPITVKTAAQELRKLRSDLTIYGEPWTGGGPTHFGKGVQRGTTVGVFNDHIRNAIRGDLDGTSTGFATGSGGDIESVKRGIMGAIDDFASAPTETVSYISAHDNRTFWDKLEYTYAGMDDNTKRSIQKLAHGIVLTSQGMAFLHGGSDFARTKFGNHNSYNAGDDINKFDWDRKAEYIDVFNYFKGLIALRKAHPAFRMTTASNVKRNISFLSAPNGVIAYTIDAKRVGDDWNRILVIFNGEPSAQTIELPSGHWNIVVDDQNAGTSPLRKANNRVTLPQYSMIVAYK